MMQRIRNFTDLIAGDDQYFSFEHRIFNLISFFIFLFTMVGGISNYLIGLHPMTVYLSIAGWCISGALYYRSRLQGIFNLYSIAFYTLGTMLCLGGMYFYNAGMSGTTVYLIVMLLNVLLIIVPPRASNYYWLCAVLYLTMLTDILLEYAFPEMIIGYATPMEKLLDHTITLIYSIIITMIVIIAFRSSYDKERERARKQNNELKLLNEQIAQQKEALMKQAAELEQSYQSLMARNEFIQTLLRELNHRVKNNLQLVSSLLSLQGGRLEDEAAKQIVLESKNRLVSVLLIHQRLYGDDHSTDVAMHEYLPELVETIMYSYFGNFNEDTAEYKIAPVSLHVEKAIPLALIANELITNSFKHAFKETSLPKLLIAFEQRQGQYVFEISDNGCGLPANVHASGHTFGLRLVDSLVQQLGGQLEMNTGNGTRIRVLFGNTPYL
ncbi:histidine kinase dimerization/phosphoacceptor domain -containing protein [uncultured Chitinophaga sp.]|uniref:sensor histidine kinase n=1 Tax=uncultured Chitinophaga sp. TaxID=339340 RepID=UPI0025D2CC23|nr:histidine kinase dimerization/phosphoacceptor domain -containing protein [uncultured Chitinophaga sp.]